MDCSPPGSSVYGISQARLLEWVAISSSRGSFPPREWSSVSCLAGRFFTTEPPRKPFGWLYHQFISINSSYHCISVAIFLGIFFYLKSTLNVISIISLSRKYFFHYMHFEFHFPLTIFPQDAFSSPFLSIMQTFSMMLGDINYHDAFLEPYLRNELKYPLLSFVHLITFTMFVPIVLMNLLVSNLSFCLLSVDQLGYLRMKMLFTFFCLLSQR